ncbi:MAG: PAS domain S-box protein [Rubrivivax sp.]|nr:PAS domain S-box protein [Rubrivivax sp.]
MKARRQSALLKTGALQSAILNSANFSSIATDDKGVIQLFNIGAERMLGYAAADVMNLITPADFSDPQEVIQRAQALSAEFGTAIAPGFEALVFKASRGIEDIYELTYLRKNGTCLPAVVSVTALRDAQHTIIGYLLIGTDNTARKQAEEALLKAGALQSAIFNSANFSSIATDAKGVIQIFNVGAERMLGYTAAEVMNKITPADISDPQEVIARAKALSEELATPIEPGFEALVFKASRGIEDIYELTYIRKDGSRFPAVVSVTALRDDQDVIIGYLLIGTDNTARKKIEAERQRLDQALHETNLELQGAKVAAERANRAKSDFLSSMSHELRSPLNAILGFAQLMDSGSPPPTAPQKDSIDQILQAGWYLLELINEVLDLALIESGRLSLSMEPMSLAEVLGDCQAMIEPQARKSAISVGFCTPDTPLFVKADRTRVKQIFVNLLSNAIKYNRVGGTVEVSCRARPGGRVRVSFQDTGEGLPPDKLAQLFQPFNRLGQEAGIEEGTGIGLVVCKQLVELMGGEIGVDSTVGVGSLFWIELNAALGIAVPAGALPAVATAAAGVAAGTPMRTVLCVEDNPANLLLVARLLARRPDIQLLSAKDGRRGIEMAHAAMPEVILMDINLPGISGLTALKILAGDPATAHIPVIALSANAMPRDIQKGLEAGFFRYLTKPIKVNEFMDTLDLALQAARTRSHDANHEATSP